MQTLWKAKERGGSTLVFSVMPYLSTRKIGNYSGKERIAAFKIGFKNL